MLPFDFRLNVRSLTRNSNKPKEEEEEKEKNLKRNYFQLHFAAQNARNLNKSEEVLDKLLKLNSFLFFLSLF